MNFLVLLVGVFSHLHASSALDQCAPVVDALKYLTGTDCGRSFCNGGQTVNPVNPPVNPVNPPVNPINPVASSTDVFIGTYFPNWFVYGKHYMGLEGINKAGESRTPEQTESKYTLWPSQLGDAVLSKINHLYYAFFKLDERCYFMDMDVAASWYGKDKDEPVWIKTPSGACKGLLRDMMAVKAKYPHIKMMISLGGWTFSEHFSKCAATSDGLNKMYETTKKYLEQMDSNWGTPSGMWSGIDFDWEHPGTAAAHTNFDAQNDWKNYAKLVEYFRSRSTQDGRTAFILTSAIGVGDTLDLLAADHDSAVRFCNALNAVNLMTYDLHGKWEPITGHNAQFCEIDPNVPNARPSPSKRWSIVSSVERLGKHCGNAKLTLGIPNYTPAWTGVAPANDGLYQTAESNAHGFALWSTFSDSDKALEPQGIIAWWDLKEAVAQGGFQVHSKNCPADKGVTVPVKWVYSDRYRAFACYEDEETVERKTQWARAVGMQGFFFWDATQDKHGDLVEAGRKGWGGLPTWPATGSMNCNAGNKPDYAKDPMGNKVGFDGCHKNSRSIIQSGSNYCAALQQQAVAICGSKKPIVVGGRRASDDGKCHMPCDAQWGAGPLQVGDHVYFVCEGETPDDKDGGATTGNNNNNNNNNSNSNNNNNNGGGARGQCNGKFSIPNGPNGCFQVKDVAAPMCTGGSKPQYRGSMRNGKCVSVCTLEGIWDAGLDGFGWPEDTVHFDCV